MASDRRLVPLRASVAAMHRPATHTHTRSRTSTTCRFLHPACAQRTSAPSRLCGSPRTYVVLVGSYNSFFYSVDILFKASPPWKRRKYSFCTRKQRRIHNYYNRRQRYWSHDLSAHAFSAPGSLSAPRASTIYTGTSQWARIHVRSMKPVVRP